MNINEMAQRPKVWGWVDVGGVEMYLAGNDCGVCLKVLHAGAYEPRSLALWRDLCSQGGLVVDVGAHTGIYTLMALKEGCAVVSIEPYMLNYARLSMNVRKNGFDDVGLFHGAADQRDGLSALAIKSNRSYCTSGGTISAGRGEFPVRVVRLDALIEGLATAIKIDVEGSAKNVLRGAERILKDTPDLLIECTEDGLTEILSPLGYKFFIVHEDRLELEPCETLTPLEDLNRLNRYCTVRP